MLQRFHLGAVRGSGRRSRLRRDLRTTRSGPEAPQCGHGDDPQPRGRLRRPRGRLPRRARRRARLGHAWTGSARMAVRRGAHAPGPWDSSSGGPGSRSHGPAAGRGYRLARPAAGVSLLEVVEVGEGGLLRVPGARSGAFPATGERTARCTPRCRGPPRPSATGSPRPPSPTSLPKSAACWPARWRPKALAHSAGGRLRLVVKAKLDPLDFLDVDALLTDEERDDPRHRPRASSRDRVLPGIARLVRGGRVPDASVATRDRRARPARHAPRGLRLRRHERRAVRPGLPGARGRRLAASARFVSVQGSLAMFPIWKYGVGGAEAGVAPAHGRRRGRSAASA